MREYSTPTVEVIELRVKEDFLLDPIYGTPSDNIPDDEG